MPFNEDKPFPFQEGRAQLSAEQLNQVREIGLRQVHGGKFVRADYYGDRVTISSKPPIPRLPEISNYLVQFVVLNELDDCLLCTPFTQPDDGKGRWTPQVYNSDFGTGLLSQILVAKPFMLQRTPWDGKVAEVDGHNLKYVYSGISTRYAYDQDGSLPFNYNIQQITPSYLRGEIITAARGLTGYYDVVGGPVIWQDLNTAGRYWQSQGQSGSIFLGGDATVVTSEALAIGYFLVPRTGLYQISTTIAVSISAQLVSNPATIFAHLVSANSGDVFGSDFLVFSTAGLILPATVAGTYISSATWMGFLQAKDSIGLWIRFVNLAPALILGGALGSSPTKLWWSQLDA